MPVRPAPSFRPGPAGPPIPAGSGAFGPGHKLPGHIGPGHSDVPGTSGPGRSAQSTRAISSTLTVENSASRMDVAGRGVQARRLNRVIRSKITVAAAIEVISAWS